MESETAAGLFGALANADRLTVLRTLVVAGPNGMAAGEIASAIGATPSRASFHLRALADAGLVHAERQARSIRYLVDYGRLGAIARYLLEDCCRNDARVRACCTPTAPL